MCKLIRAIALGVAIACMCTALIASCASQGHTTTTTVFASIGAAVTAFLAAPLEGLTALALAMLVALGIISFSPKYPLEPARSPAGEESADKPGPTYGPPQPAAAPNEKSILDKTWWEVIFHE